ncbi:MAG: IMP dehydrogenase, partial [Armatimonadota bacterium]|nr:IMP dehydrogenase [Armatimonadota bacterium]
MPQDTFRLGLTFDDVLLVPKRSSLASRAEVSTRTCLCRGIEMEIPIVSANMDSVTESEMAIAMARVGGIGIIHRFLPIEQQAAEVRRVKRAESVVIDRPYTFRPHQTLREAVAFMEEHGSAGLLVVDEEERLVGLVTARDLLFEEDLDQPIRQVMTSEGLITAPVGTSLEEAR